MKHYKIRGVMSIEASMIVTFFVLVFGSLMLFSFYLHDSVALQVFLYRSAISMSKENYPQRELEVVEIQDGLLMFPKKGVDFQRHDGIKSTQVVGRGSLVSHNFSYIGMGLERNSKIYIERQNPSLILRVQRQLEGLLNE